MIYVYGPPDPGAVQKLVPRVKGIAQALIARNEKR
jgi:hypothetical protein